MGSWNYQKDRTIDQFSSNNLQLIQHIRMYFVVMHHVHKGLKVPSSNPAHPEKRKKKLKWIRLVDHGNGFREKVKKMFQHKKWKFYFFPPMATFGFRFGCFHSAGNFFCPNRKWWSSGQTFKISFFSLLLTEVRRLMWEK